ncbi:hypothetical protein [Peterkaempfera griseoplana]|uniref:hypothetical protein n=1 Tax=Peterkaempfera griseoplana TaxID=66896 RepID=UPI0006E212FB|nr:hypothetical protein [Peterkaempfera griseoplana]
MTTMHVDPNTGEITDEPKPMPLAELLINHMKGRAHEVASTEFHQLVAAVTEHGKKGKLVVTFNVEPSKGHVDGDPLHIGIDSVLTAPKAAVPHAIYFVDGEGNPSREDPRQISPGLFRDSDGTPEFRLPEDRRPTEFRG